MFCWRTEARDRKVHTRPDQQGQLIWCSAQLPSWPWCSGACLYCHRSFMVIPHGPALVNGHMKGSCVCTHSKPIISEASCAQTRKWPQDPCFLCWQWQRQFISSLTIRKKPSWWWGSKDSSMEKPNDWFYGQPSHFRNSFSEYPQAQLHSEPPLLPIWKTLGNRKGQTLRCWENIHASVHTHPCSVSLGPFHPCPMGPIQHQACIWLNTQAAPVI